MGISQVGQQLTETDQILLALQEILAELRRSNGGKEPKAREILAIKEAADYLGVSELTLREWTRMQKIPFYRHGQKFIRFRRSKLDKWLEQHDVPVRD